MRLIAFRQIHKILGVEQLKPRNRKRRHDSETEESQDIESGDNENKKDRKDPSESNHQTSQDSTVVCVKVEKSEN